MHANGYSSWSATRALTVDHFTYAMEAWAMSYGEALGSNTITNVTAHTAASQGSYIEPF